MKKSNFLHKPKDLLSKSFNPAKCKTALKLATSRIKLLKNKKENQVKQMKRELAQLLESGQDRTARIRVEHVIREEKMMAAYELIEIYCELVVARLTIIETQKNCPIDLKEAVTSVIFASPRCGDIPELLDVRKQFTGKYGKEFTSAAIELRPDCGVSRMLVEKLSARAPDTQAKIKTLTAIAEEHNIKWDPKLLEENETLPPNDLLNGPATFVKADRPRAEDTHFSTPHVQAPSPPTKLNPSSNLSETNIVSSQGTENPAPGSNNGSSNYVSSIPQSGVRHSGVRPDTAETGQPNHQEGSGYSFGRQNWNMNFKDAASAAHAAAESAEHANMAARAAANFAKQYSPESEDLSGHSLRGEGTGKHSTSKVGEYYAPTESSSSRRVENELKGRQHSAESQKLHVETRSPSSKFTDDHHPPRNSANSSFAEQPPEVQNVRRENVGNNNTHRASEKSYGNNVGIDKLFPQTLPSTSKASFDSDPLSTGHQEAERYSENSFFKGEELEPELTLKNVTYKDEPERLNSHVDGFIYHDHDIFEQDKITKQSSNINSSPHSISGFDDNFVDSGPEKHGSDSSDHHFVNISQDLFDKMAESSSHHDGGPGGVVSFDDYGSDEEFGFPNSSRLNFKDESTLFRPSGRTSPPRLFADTGSGTVGFPASGLHKESESLFPIKQNVFAEFSESSDVVVDSSEQEKIGPLMFDDSDDPSSDNETDMDHQPWVHNVKDSTDLPSKQYQTLSSASSSSHESQLKNNQRNKTGVQRQEDFGLNKAPVDNSSPGLGKSRRNSGLVGEVETSSSSSITQMDDDDSHHGLNFGKLTGGLRHKGRTRFPYQSSQSDDFSTSPTVMSDPAHATENFTNVKKSEFPENERPLRLPSSNLDSDSETSEEVYEKKPARKSTVKPNVRSPVRYFDSESSRSEDDDDDDDDSAKQGFTGQSSPFGSGVSIRTKGTLADSTSTGSGVSRRTKANTPADSSSFSSKFQANSYVSSNSGEGRRTSTSSFSGSETPPPSESHVQRSGQFKVLERPSPARKGYNISNMESNVSANIENKKPSAGAQTGTTEQKGELPSGGNVNTRKDSGKQASHVHPKLPDYDTIASRLQALRTNRQ